MNLFDQARSTDPENSHIAAKRDRSSQRDKLLIAYYSEFMSPSGTPISDALAGEKAGVATAHKRCSELLRAGLIKKDGNIPGPNGTPVRACSITPAGISEIRTQGDLG